MHKIKPIIDRPSYGMQVSSDSNRNTVSPGSSMDSNQNSHTITQNVKAFCSETSAHGVGQIVKDVSVTYRVTWFIVVLAVTFGGAAHIYHVIYSYTTYPSQETTSLSSRDPWFPYITICNAQAGSLNNENAYRSDVTTDYGQYATMILAMEQELLEYEYRTGHPLDDLLLSPNGVFSNIAPESVSSIGHQLKDFILRCQYLGQPCDMDRDWIQFITADFFNCYTYIGPSGDVTGKVAPGPVNGLSLVLYMENTVPDMTSYNYTYNIYSNVQNAYGARLEVHEQDTLATPSTRGVDIMPGHSTSIGLRETVVEKLIEPWGDCTHRRRLADLNEYKYSAHSCMEVCVVKYIYENCGCFIPLTPVPDSIRQTNFTMCSKFDNTTTFDELVSKMQCSLKYDRKFNFNKNIRDDFCDCREHCDFHQYDLILSENIWPAALYQLDTYYEFVLNRNDSRELLATRQMFEAWARAYTNISESAPFSNLMYNNFARVNIYYESMYVEERIQTASIGIWSLFANLGGTLGLWAGLSICTIVEVMFFIVKLCLLAVDKCKERN